MNLMTKKDFNIFVDAYLKEVEKHQIERVYFHFSCGYTKKEAKESEASLELIEYNVYGYAEPTWVWLHDWDEGQKFVCLYGVYKESDIIKILSDYYDSNTKDRMPEHPLCGTPQHSLCGTCRNRLNCRLSDDCAGCFKYERQSNPLDEIVTETRSLNPIKEENNMEAWEQVEKTRDEGKRLKYDEAVFNQEQAEKLYNLIKERDSINNYEKIEITFKSGETISYGKDEWDDYAYDGKAVIVKKNSTWIGIYNFDDVFCVELKEK